MDAPGCPIGTQNSPQDLQRNSGGQRGLSSDWATMYFDGDLERGFAFEAGSVGYGYRTAGVRDLRGDMGPYRPSTNHPLLSPARAPLSHSPRPAPPAPELQRETGHESAGSLFGDVSRDEAGLAVAAVPPRHAAVRRQRPGAPDQRRRLRRQSRIRARGAARTSKQVPTRYSPLDEHGLVCSEATKCCA